MCHIPIYYVRHISMPWVITQGMKEFIYMYIWNFEKEIDEIEDGGFILIYFFGKHKISSYIIWDMRLISILSRSNKWLNPSL